MYTYMYTYVCAHMVPEEGVECPALSCHHFLREGLSMNLGLDWWPASPTILLSQFPIPLRTGLAISC